MRTTDTATLFKSLAEDFFAQDKAWDRLLTYRDLGLAEEDRGAVAAKKQLRDKGTQAAAKKALSGGGGGGGNSGWKKVHGGGLYRYVNPASGTSNHPLVLYKKDKDSEPVLGYYSQFGGRSKFIIANSGKIKGLGGAAKTRAVGADGEVDEVEPSAKLQMTELRRALKAVGVSDPSRVQGDELVQAIGKIQKNPKLMTGMTQAHKTHSELSRAKRDLRDGEKALKKLEQEEEEAQSAANKSKAAGAKGDFGGDSASKSAAGNLRRIQVEKEKAKFRISKAQDAVNQAEKTVATAIKMGGYSGSKPAATKAIAQVRDKTWKVGQVTKSARHVAAARNSASDAMKALRSGDTAKAMEHLQSMQGSIKDAEEVADNVSNFSRDKDTAAARETMLNKSNEAKAQFDDLKRVADVMKTVQAASGRATKGLEKGKGSKGAGRSLSAAKKALASVAGDERIMKGPLGKIVKDMQDNVGFTGKVGEKIKSKEAEGAAGKRIAKGQKLLKKAHAEREKAERARKEGKAAGAAEHARKAKDYAQKAQKQLDLAKDISGMDDEDKAARDAAAAEVEKVRDDVEKAAGRTADAAIPPLDQKLNDEEMAALEKRYGKKGAANALRMAKTMKGSIPGAEVIPSSAKPNAVDVVKNGKVVQRFYPAGPDGKGDKVTWAGKGPGEGDMDADDQRDMRKFALRADEPEMKTAASASTAKKAAVLAANADKDLAQLKSKNPFKLGKRFNFRDSAEDVKLVKDYEKANEELKRLAKKAAQGKVSDARVNQQFDVVRALKNKIDDKLAYKKARRELTSPLYAPKRAIGKMQNALNQLAPGRVPKAKDPADAFKDIEKQAANRADAAETELDKAQTAMRNTKKEASKQRKAFEKQLQAVQQDDSLSAKQKDQKTREIMKAMSSDPAISKYDKAKRRAEKLRDAMDRNADREELVGKLTGMAQVAKAWKGARDAVKKVKGDKAFMSDPDNRVITAKAAKAERDLKRLMKQAERGEVEPEEVQKQVDKVKDLQQQVVAKKDYDKTNRKALAFLAKGKPVPDKVLATLQDKATEFNAAMDDSGESEELETSFKSILDKLSQNADPRRGSGEAEGVPNKVGDAMGALMGTTAGDPKKRRSAFKSNLRSRRGRAAALMQTMRQQRVKSAEDKLDTVADKERERLSRVIKDLGLDPDEFFADWEPSQGSVSAKLADYMAENPPRGFFNLLFGGKKALNVAAQMDKKLDKEASRLNKKLSRAGVDPDTYWQGRREGPRFQDQFDFDWDPFDYYGSGFGGGKLGAKLEQADGYTKVRLLKEAVDDLIVSLYATQTKDPVAFHEWATESFRNVNGAALLQAYATP